MKQFQLYRSLSVSNSVNYRVKLVILRMERLDFPGQEMKNAVKVLEPQLKSGNDY